MGREAEGKSSRQSFRMLWEKERARMTTVPAMGRRERKTSGEGRAASCPILPRFLVHRLLHHNPLPPPRLLIEIHQQQLLPSR
jgi:hypothetical protein